MSGPAGDPRPKKKKPPGDGNTDDGASVYRQNPKKKTGTRTGDPNRVPREALEGPGWLERIVYGRVSSGQLSVVCRQLAAYLHAGVDLQKSLVNLELQFSRTALGPVLGRVRNAIKRGDTFHEAVKAEPQAFDPLFIAMAKVAEARGGLPETLKDMGKHYEARQRLIRQARSALIYPVIVLLIASGVVALLTIWLLPMFADLLKDIAGRGATLPLPSRALMAFSAFVRTVGWFVIPAVMVGTPFAILAFYRTAGGKKLLDRVALWFPVFGPLLRKIETVRVARSLSALLDAGLDIGASLDLTSGVARLDPTRVGLLRVKDEVMHGRELSDSFRETRLFTPDVIAVMNAGEETGKLPESLEHLADDYEEQVEYAVKNLGQLIQPFLMIALGGLVLFIILAVLLPYISMLTSLAGG